jgi:hypothetical protein
MLPSLSTKTIGAVANFQKISWKQVLTTLKFFPQEIEDKKFNAPF